MRVTHHVTRNEAPRGLRTGIERPCSYTNLVADNKHFGGTIPCRPNPQRDSSYHLGPHLTLPVGSENQLVTRGHMRYAWDHAIGAYPSWLHQLPDITQHPQSTVHIDGST